MRFQLISDIHVEFHRDRGASFLNSLDSTGVDLLIVAGDIGGSADDLEPAFDILCAKYPEVAFVLGNHDFYKSGMRRTEAAAAAAVSKHNNLHWLDESTIVVEGMRVVGTSLWFPSDRGHERDRDSINDFRLIPSLDGWVFLKNRRAQEFLRREVRRGDVVVTHHMPSHKCTHPKYRGSPLNRYFVCDMEDLILERQPAYCLFGHTHEQVREKIGDCQLVCNPLGYAGVEPEANMAFDDHLVMEV